MKNWLALVVSLLCLAATLWLFLYSAMAAAADAQGIFLFFFLLVPMAALLGLSAYLTRKALPRAYRATLVLGALVGGFLVCAPIPGLNLYTAAVIGGVSWVYERIYGESPYAAHHHRVDLAGLVEKSLEAQGDTLDLRGLNLPVAWDRLCLFGPGAEDKDAAAAGLPADWPLSLYSKVKTEKVTALALVGDKYPVYVADLPLGKIEFAPEAVRRCYPREQASFHRRSQDRLFVADKKPDA